MTSPEQYWTIEQWLGPLPAWVPATDQHRIAAYAKYEEIYWSSEQGFEEVMRGDNDNPVFMPTARTLVNTVARYTAPGFGWQIKPLEGSTDSTVVQIAQLAFDNLFVREQFVSKFNSEKNKGIRRGDWLFHIFADDTKPLGRRIKIVPVHPSAYFPVYESDIIEGGDDEKLVKVHLAQVVRIGGQEKVTRLTYERLFDSNGLQTGIQVSQGVYALDKWSALDGKPERTVIPTKMLPDSIPAIPIYHLKNIDSTDRFGSSELRGSESTLLGINQTMSDEDLALAMDGLGVYATDTGSPVDEAGNKVDFIMGPGRVLSNAGNLRRISGVGSVTPYGDHYNRLFDAVMQAAGVSDVAMGKVESAEAESGIALLLRLGPILSYTGDKDQNVIDVTSQMFHDLCFWLTEYEELPLTITGEGGEVVPAVQVLPLIGDKIPKNNKAIFDQIISLRSLIPPLISIVTSHSILRSIGIPIPEGEDVTLAKERAAEAAALLAIEPVGETVTEQQAAEELAAIPADEEVL